jgi:trehalose 6-phosphate phosphatase
MMSGAALEIKEQTWFLSKLSEAAKRVLVIDYDGTIAPFCSDREKAVPYPGIPELLERIEEQCNTRLIIITGRRAHEVVPLLGLIPFPEIWGTYGLERLHRDSSRWWCRSDETEISDEAIAALSSAELQLDAEGLRDHIEVKMAGVAIHWRGLQPQDVLNLRKKAYRIIEPLTRSRQLVMAEFDRGVELRLHSANKGEAVRKLLQELDPNVPVAYLGDDATDEEAFRALNGRGLTVLVGPKQRFTSAQVWLRPPEELTAFLNDWVRSCGGK